MRPSPERLRPLLIPLVVVIGLCAWVAWRGPVREVTVVRQERLDTAGPPLADGRALSQTFVSPRSGLQAVELLLVAYDAERSLPKGSEMVLTLERIDEAGGEATRTALALEGRRHNDVLRFAFAPLGDSGGATYRLTFSATGDASVSVWHTAGDAYAHGEMYLDGAPVPGDLYFRTQHAYTWWDAVEEGAALALDGVRYLPGLLLVALPGWVLALLMPLPGWLDGWARATLVVALALAFWAVLLLWTGTAGVRLTGGAAWVLAGVVAAGGCVAVAKGRRVFAARGGPRRDRVVDVTLGLVMLLVAATRMLQVRDLVVPNWVDSVHHTVLTELLVREGGVPWSYEPFFPVEALHYHFGFHAAAAGLCWYGGVEAHEAVLVLGQVLNALAPLAAYTLTVWLLRRRWAGVAAAVVAGAASYLPAYYASWGRYTQLAGLVMLPAVCLVATEAVRAWRSGGVHGSGGEEPARRRRSQEEGGVGGSAGLQPRARVTKGRKRPWGGFGGRHEENAGGTPAVPGRGAGGECWRGSFERLRASSFEGVPSQSLRAGRAGAGGPGKRGRAGGAGGPRATGAGGRWVLWAGVLAGGLFTTHYRVLILFAVLWPAYVVYVLTRRDRWRIRELLRAMARGLPLVAGVALLVTAPWVVRFVVHVVPRVGSIYGGLGLAEEGGGAPSWGLLEAYWMRPVAGVALVGLGWGVVRRRAEVVLVGVWVGLWFLAANLRLVGLRDWWVLDNDSVLISLWLPMSVVCGWLADEAVTVVTAGVGRVDLGRAWGVVRPGVFCAGLLGLALAGSWAHLDIVNPVTVLVTEDDVAAMDWVRENVPEDALFAINARRWQGTLYMGTDGGWWLPLLAGRRTTLPAVLYHVGEPEYVRGVNELAGVVEGVGDPDDPAFVARLVEAGVTHVYVGARGGPLMPRDLDGSVHYRAVHERGPVRVYEVKNEG